MALEFHPIEVVLGDDGSCAIEGVPEGRVGAKRTLTFLFGEVPTEGTYATNPLWDWLYFPPGSITSEQRSRIVDIGPIREVGSCVYKLHEVPHVEQPGAYTESFFEILKEPWVGRVVAGVVSIVLFAVAAVFWINTREPGYAQGSLSDVIAASETPYTAPRFVDRLAIDFADGDHLSIPISVSDVLHRGPAAVVFDGGSRNAYLVKSGRLGETVANILQYPGPALRFDTSRGPDHILLERADGTWGEATLYVLHIGPALEGVHDREIRYNDDTTFAAGTTYAFEGGIESSEGNMLLYRRPRANIPYKVALDVDDPGLSALFEYLSSRNYAVTIVADLEGLRSEDEREGNRVIGHTGTNLALSFARRTFVAGR